jgi:tripartite-type tricarboxylate transporter receptor subunit TctC
VQEPELRRTMVGMNTPIDFREGGDFQAFLDADGKRLAQTIRKMGKTQ